MRSLLIAMFVCLFVCLPMALLAEDTQSTDNISQLATIFWHQQLAQYINVNADKVKLAQGNMVLGSTSYQLWNVYNANSNAEASIYYNPSQLNNFSSDYGLLLYNLPINPVPDPDCNINQAILDFSAANGKYPWSKTINELNSALSNSKAMSLVASTQIPSSSSDSANYELTLKANYQRFVLYYAQPYSKQSAQLADYSSWYYQCALMSAYNDKNSPYWSATFGPQGYLQNVTVALVVVENGSVCLDISIAQQRTEHCSPSAAPSIIAVVISPIGELDSLWQ